jgi:hypothetical protein
MIDEEEEHIGVSVALEDPVAFGDSLNVPSQHPQKVFDIDLRLGVVNHAALAYIGAIYFIE